MCRYGIRRSLLPQGEYLELSHERLDEKQMEERMLQMENGWSSMRLIRMPK